MSMLCANLFCGWGVACDKDWHHGQGRELRADFRYALVVIVKQTYTRCLGSWFFGNVTDSRIRSTVCVRDLDLHMLVANQVHGGVQVDWQIFGLAFFAVRSRFELNDAVEFVANILPRQASEFPPFAFDHLETGDQRVFYCPDDSFRPLGHQSTETQARFLLLLSFELSEQLQTERTIFQHQHDVLPEQRKVGIHSRAWDDVVKSYRFVAMLLDHFFVSFRDFLCPIRKSWCRSKLRWLGLRDGRRSPDLRFCAWWPLPRRSNSRWHVHGLSGVVSSWGSIRTDRKSVV